MLPFDVTIPATVPQRSGFPEGLMNYPVFRNYTLLKTRMLMGYFQESQKALQNLKKKAICSSEKLLVTYKPQGVIT